MKGKLPFLFAVGITIFSFSFSTRAKDVAPFVQLPFDIASGYLIFSVPIEPSGSLSLLFDTGCQTATISKDVLDIENRGQAITLLLGTQKLKVDNYRISPKTDLSKAAGQRVDGVIGNDLLHRYTVKIDFKKKVLSLFESEEFITYPDGDAVGIEVNSLVSSVLLKITFSGGKQVEGKFMIDTGAPIHVLLNSPVAEKSGLQSIMKNAKKKEFKTLADVQSAAPALAKSVRIGRFECADMEVFISTSKKGLFAGSKYTGIVGIKFFQNFNVIFDYRRKSLHIEKF